MKPLSQVVLDMPIRHKLVLIVMVTTASALIMTGIGIMLADFFLFRTYLENDLSALARIVVDNTTASLAFQDPAVANETLATLRARSHVVTACIFTQDGSLFARYIRPHAQAACPGPETNGEMQVQSGSLFVSRPILLGDRRLGTLVLLYDLGESEERIRLYGFTVLGVLLFSTVLAFLLSARLRSLIATPIVELARITSKVSSSRDYQIRAERFSGDELGLLVDDFNQMLSSIQSRDNELHQALLERSAALEDVQKARESLETTLDSVAQLNEELRRSNENLARSNEDLERFAFVASHDLQEPLRMITIYSQLLARNYGRTFDKRGAEFIQYIEGGAKRMRELLADLLAYAEIGARFEVPVQPVDLNSVVERVRENLALAFAESGAAITVAKLPVILGFESHFIPLFQNLIGNAIKYRSEQQPEIDICATRVNGHVRICVADNGIGIAPEYHSKIFVAFKRLHGKKIAGTGIGLAICQRVVEKYGGKLWVESDVGQGSKFFFTLPAELVANTDGEVG